MEKTYIHQNGQWELKKSEDEENELKKYRKPKDPDDIPGDEFPEMGPHTVQERTITGSDGKPRKVPVKVYNEEKDPGQDSDKGVGIGARSKNKAARTRVGGDTFGERPTKEKTKSKKVKKFKPKIIVRKQVEKSILDRLDDAIESLQKAYDWRTKRKSWDFSGFKGPNPNAVDEDKTPAIVAEQRAKGIGRNPDGSAWNKLAEGLNNQPSTTGDPGSIVPGSVNPSPWNKPWDGDFSKLEHAKSLKEIFDTHGGHAVKDLIHHAMVEHRMSPYDNSPRLPQSWNQALQDDTGTHPLINELQDKYWKRDDTHFPGGDTHDKIIKQLWDDGHHQSAGHVVADGAWKRFQHEQGHKQPKHTDYGHDLSTVDWDKITNLKDLHQKHGSPAVKAAIQDVIKGAGDSHSGRVPDHLLDEITQLGSPETDEAARPFFEHALSPTPPDIAVRNNSLKAANRINREGAFRDFAKKNGINPHG